MGNTSDEFDHTDANLSALDALATVDEPTVSDGYTISQTEFCTLLLVVCGEKPLTGFSYSLEPEDWNGFEQSDVSQHIDDLGVYYHKAARMYARDDPFLIVKYEVAQTRSDYDLVQGHAYDHKPRAKYQADRYGYPEEAVDAYIQFYADGGEHYGRKAQKYRWSLYEQDVFTADELAYLVFINWIPPLTEDAFEAAISEGKRRYNKLLEFTQSHGLEESADRVREYYNECVDYFRDETRPEYLTEEDE